MCTKALILAAGQGTRLRPLTDTCPKPMLPIQGRPLLAHLVEWLRSHGIREIAVNLHHRPEVITDYFGDGGDFGVAITYSREDPILGTAGAVRRLASFFGPEAFVVVYGDVLTDLDLTALIAAHGRYRLADPQVGLTLSLMTTTNPTEVGLVERGLDGKITRFVEKPSSDQVFTDQANAGILVMEPALIDFIPARTFFDFGLHLFPSLLSAGVPMYGWAMPQDAYCLDIGSHEKYRQAQQEWPGLPSTWAGGAAPVVNRSKTL